MSQPPRLRISANNSLVEVQLEGDSQEQSWKNAVIFWSTFSLDQADETKILIPLRDFYPRRAWFGSYWLDSGLEIDTEPSLSEAIEAVEEEIKTFEKLTGTGYGTMVGGFGEELGLKRSLTDEQMINVLSMSRAPNGANFSVPGAGKTSTQLTLYKYLYNLGLVEKMLVVCPKSAFEAWLEEPLAIFNNPPKTMIYDGTLIEPSTEVLLVNFEKLESEKRLDKLISWTMSQKTLLVIDEAHRIKGGTNSVRWKACSKIASVSTRVDILTGTPMPQSYEDLRNLFSASWKNVPRSYLSDESLARLKPGGVFVRTTKGQLGLPPIDIKSITTTMGPIQTEIYAALGKNYIGQLQLKSQDRLALSKKGRAVMTLLACASNPALISTASREEMLAGMNWPPAELEGTDLMGALLSYMSYEVPTKYEWIAKYLAQASSSGRKTLIWSSFVGNLVLLQKFLKPFNPALVHGGVTKDERIEQINKFRFDPSCSVLLTNPQTLGEGISLHKDAHEAIFLDRTYNAAQYLQALDRIHRLGLPEHQLTTVYLLGSKASIDERVNLRLEVKIKRLAEMLEDPGLTAVSLPQGDEFETVEDLIGFDEVDLDDLLAHLKSEFAT